MYKLQEQYLKHFDPDLTYEDYDRILKAKSGHWEKSDKPAMELLVPYFTKGYLQTDRTSAIWLTVKGTRVLQAAGCDPLDPREFLANYPHLLDRMKDDESR
jgi:hypothetical protein